MGLWVFGVVRFRSVYMGCMCHVCVSVGRSGSLFTLYMIRRLHVVRGL